MIEPAILYILSINNQRNAILSLEFFTFNWTKGLQNINGIGTCGEQQEVLRNNVKNSVTYYICHRQTSLFEMFLKICGVSVTGNNSFFQLVYFGVFEIICLILY